MFSFKKSTLQKALKKYQTDKIASYEQIEDRVNDELAADDFLIINTQGNYIFVYKSAAELLQQHKTCINEIIYLCNSACRVVNKELTCKVLTLIKTLARMVSTVPASQGCHDVYNAGLFKHSLLVCKFALHEYLNSSLYRSNTQNNLVYALVIAALIHDLGKVFCDFKLKAYKQERYFNPYIEILDDFLQQSKCKYFCLDFTITKNLEHDDLICMLIGRFLHEANCFELLDQLEELIDLKAYFFKEGELWQIVKKADAYCVALHNSKAVNHLEVAPFLMNKLKVFLKEHDSLVNVTAGLAYNTNYGCIIPYDGDLVYMLCHWYGAMSIGSNIDQSNASFGSVLLFLRKKGYLTFFGRNRIYSWYKITINDDVIFVKGFILKALSLNSATVNCILLGDKPSELMPFFQDRESKTIAGQIVLSNQALATTYTKEAIAGAQYISGQAKGLYEELIQRRNKQRLNEKKAEFRDFKFKVNAQKHNTIDIDTDDFDLAVFDDLF